MVNAAFLTVEYLRRASFVGKVFVVGKSGGIVSELEAAGIEFVLARLEQYICVELFQTLTLHPISAR